ncbi:hypothetical protein [Streptomyces sp. NPDC052811]|uniref:hypothetical protein n=1 Tax=Streptomyces sp. NPDC052811 TaxID=3155731 RepID=UPI00341AAF21
MLTAEYMGESRHLLRERRPSGPGRDVLRAADNDRRHPDPDLAGPRFEISQFREVDHLRAAELLYDERFHRSVPPVGCAAPTFAVGRVMSPDGLATEVPVRPFALSVSRHRAPSVGSGI